MAAADQISAGIARETNGDFVIPEDGHGQRGTHLALGRVFDRIVIDSPTGQIKGLADDLARLGVRVGGAENVEGALHGQGAGNLAAVPSTYPVGNQGDGPDFTTIFGGVRLPEAEVVLIVGSHRAGDRNLGVS